MSRRFTITGMMREKSSKKDWTRKKMKADDTFFVHLISGAKKWLSVCSSGDVKGGRGEAEREENVMMAAAAMRDN